MAADAIPRTFRQLEQDWRPAEASATDQITAAPPTGFAALLDQPPPVVREGDPLPPLWHWLFFLPTPWQSALGEDGHPTKDAYVPPLAQRRRMFGGGHLEIRAPLRHGEQVTRRTSMPSVRATSGASGPLLITTTRHEFLVDDEIRVVEEQFHVYRQAEDVARTTTPSAANDSVRPQGSLTLTFPTDPVSLFRFSALTWNPHRIHYDQAYTTETEGYPDLVVHGPLVALLLLELPRRAGRAVRTFDWRAKAPMFVGETVEAFGCLTDGGLSLTAGANGAWKRVVGTVTLNEPIT